MMRKTILLFWKTFHRLSIRKLGILFRITFSQPLFSVLTVYATAKTMSLSKEKFPQTHQSSELGNAYRHALWSSLIMIYGCKVSSVRKTKIWCQKITSLHEELFPNPVLERKMDLHNNKIGIELFLEMEKGIHRQFFETSFILEKLDKKLKTAKIITFTDEEFPNELVYLKN